MKRPTDKSFRSLYKEASHFLIFGEESVCLSISSPLMSSVYGLKSKHDYLSEFAVLVTPFFFAVAHILHLPYIFVKAFSNLIKEVKRLALFSVGSYRFIVLIGGDPLL